MNSVNEMASGEMVISNLDYSRPPSFSQIVRSFRANTPPDRGGPIAQGGEVNIAIDSNPSGVSIPNSGGLRYTAVFKPGAGGTLNDHLLSSGYSCINRLRLLGTNGLPIDEINNDFNVLANFLVNNTFSSTERVALSGLYGFSDVPGNVTKTIVGAPLIGAGANAVVKRNFFLPLPLAYFGAQNEKYFPLAFFSDLRLNCVFEPDIQRICLGDNATAINRCASVTFEDIELVYDGVELTPGLMGALMSVPRYILKSTAWRISSTSDLSTGRSGNNTILVNSRYRSVKSMWAIPSQTNGLGLVYGSVNPNIRRCNWKINNSSYPSQGLEIDRRPAEALAEYFKSFGCLMSANELNGVLSYSNYCVRDTANDFYRAAVDNAQANLAALADGETPMQSFVIGCNFEYIDSTSAAKTFSMGRDLSNSNTFFEMDISQPLTDDYVMFFVSCIDSYLAIEPATKTFTVSI